MNRCIRAFGAAISLALGLGTALAQDIIRQSIPGDARLGVLQVTMPPAVLLDGKADRLSPGARIRAENNMMVLSGALAGQSLLVAYVREPQGLLHEVWILNAAERAAVLQKRASAAPTPTPTTP